MEKKEMESKIVELETLVGSLLERLTAVEAEQKKIADRRGPKSDREMTDDDARRIMDGDLAKKTHKDAAETLGLSYAQVYSARKGFTFKHIAKEIAAKKAEAAKLAANPQPQQ